MSLKVIHVGLGQFGQDWEKNAIPPVSRVEPVAWVDAFPATLEAARDALALPADRCFTSLTAAIDAVEADAVLITAPQPVHMPLAVEALESGKHVLVEKPLAMTVAEGRAAIDLADRAGRVLMVSQQYRNYPAPRRAAQMVVDRELGPVGTVRVNFRKWAEGDETPAVMQRFYGIPHPLIYDMSIHHFDLMRLILGQDAVSVYAKVVSPPWSRYADEGAAALTIEFENGTVVAYNGSWMSTDRPTHWAGEWVIECEAGAIGFTSRVGGPAGVSGDALTITRPGAEPQTVELERPPLWGRSAGLTAFADAVANGTEPETSARFNLGSLALMEAAARSSKTGQVEPVESTKPSADR